MSKVIAVLVSDIHLSERVPAFRSAEPNWMAAEKRSLDELSSISKNLNVPIVCAGDVFDKWNSSPAIINFAIANLPKMYSIPGQHDLPNHRLDEIKRSAYWTLVEAGNLRHLVEPLGLERGLMLYPFPWGVPITPLVDKDKLMDVHLAVVHSYIWKEGFGFTGADENKKVGKYRAALAGYNTAVFGDNHQGFLVPSPDSKATTVMNCGTFFRRKSDELEYRPQIGLLCDDGSVEPHYLDTSKDLYLQEVIHEKKEIDVDTEQVIAELRQLGSDSLDFRISVNRALDLRNTGEEVRALVLESIG